MSERIKKLAERATIYIEPTPTSGEGWIFNKEKFAQLIVQECAQVYWSIDNGELHDEYVDALKKHFGVD